MKRFVIVLGIISVLFLAFVAISAGIENYMLKKELQVYNKHSAKVTHCIKKATLSCFFDKKNRDKNDISQIWCCKFTKCVKDKLKICNDMAN